MSLCDSIDTLSMAYLDDELAAEERRELELHLTECTSCRAHLDGERAEQATLHRALSDFGKCASVRISYRRNAFARCRAIACAIRNANRSSP